MGWTLFPPYTEREGREREEREEVRGNAVEAKPREWYTMNATRERERERERERVCVC